MMLDSAISWCDHTINFWVGCTPVSEGCKNCYAETANKRYVNDFSAIRRTSKAVWNQSKKWKVGDRVFVCSWSDFFHPDVPKEWRDDAWEVMRSRPDVIFMLLTKRPELIKGDIPENVWLGTTCENQKRANERLPLIATYPCSKRFVSCEPLLENIDLYKALFGVPFDRIEKDLHGMNTLGFIDGFGYGIDWVIVGGESGANRRPLNLEWVRSLISQCKDAGVPIFVKQLGGRYPGGDARIDGVEYKEFPK